MRAFKLWFDEAIVEAFREGAPNPKKWAPGLPTVGLVAAITYAALLLLVVAAGWIRGNFALVDMPGNSPIPLLTLPVLLWGIVLALSLLMGAGIHTHPVVRVLVFFTSAALFTTAIVIWPNGGLWCWLVGLTIMAGVYAARWNRGYVWWEFPLCLTAVCVTLLVPMYVVAESPLEAQSLVGLLTTQMVIVAIPTVMVAAFAIVQIPVRIATAVEPSVGKPRTLWLISMALFASVVVAETLRATRDLSGWIEDTRLLPTVLLLLLVGLFALPIFASQTRLEVPKEDLDDELGKWLYPIAIGMVFTLVPGSLLTQLHEVFRGLGVSTGPINLNVWGGELYTGRVADYVQVALAVALMILAWRIGRRGRPATGFALVGVATALGLRNVAWIAGDMRVNGWSFHGLALCLVGIVLVASAVALVRRQPVQPGPLATASLLALMMPFREVIAEPVEAAFGMMGGAMLVLGLVWRSLTDGDYTNNHSPNFHQASRFMFYAASVLFVAAALAYQALARDPSSQDINSQAFKGEFTLGGGLVLGIGLMLVIRILRPEQQYQRPSAGPRNADGAPYSGVNLPGR